MSVVVILHVGRDFVLLRACGLTRYSDALMRAQSEAGHEVAYFFAGRHFPGLSTPRLKRYRSGGIRMLELIAAPNSSHWTAGTRYPLRDIENPAVEGAFAAALREIRPDVVHVQEINGLSTRILEQAKAAGAAVVMTLHDYAPMCASVRLVDADGGVCLRRSVGEDCARNCAGAPAGYDHLVDATLRYESWRAERALPAAAPLARVLARAGTRVGSAMSIEPEPGESAPAAYQRRRDVNVRRLSACDRLVAVSARVAEIYTELGVDPARMTVQRLTLPHIAELHPRRPPGAGSPVRFVTLGALASEAKGGLLLLDAARRLHDAGRDDVVIDVHGYIPPEARELAAGLPGLRLAPTGYHPEELGDVLAGSDVGIMPSVWEESHGFVGIEMLAMGLPLIGNAIGGITEYVREGETGWLNRSSTGAELAEIIARLVDDPGAVEAMQRSVRDRRDELIKPMAAHVAEVESLYADVLPASPGGS